MSLTSELNKRTKSPIGRFFRDTFPNTRGVLADFKDALSEPRIDHLAEGASPAAYGQVGRAIDYRIRYHFAHTPSSEFVAARAADDVASSYVQPQLTGECVSSFFDELEQTIVTIAPHRRGPAESEERTLARFCLILAAFEGVFRAGPIAWPPSYFSDVAPDTAAQLLALVPDDWVDDVTALGSAFSRRHTAWRGADAVLNPNFTGSLDIGGADADLVVENCLWEIKTERRAGRMWFDQLLGYVLLDYEGEYAIDSVGVLLPRQDAQVSWPIHELIARLSGRDDIQLANLREQFRAICEPMGDSRRAAILERIAPLDS